MTPAAGVDPNQQKMMMFMPLMFGFMFYYASAGLVLYWLTGNVVGRQQLIINRFMPSCPTAARAAATESARKEGWQKVDCMKYTIESMNPKLDQFLSTDSVARGIRTGVRAQRDEEPASRG